MNKVEMRLILMLAIVFFYSCGTQKSAHNSKSEDGDSKLDNPITEKEIQNTHHLKQSDFTPQGYILTYRGLAVKEMKRTGIPASITLAQGILESSYGKSYLAREANNHFGIKCKSSWTGRSVKADDDAVGECFRAYDSPEDSYRDHSDFLVTGYRYRFLFEYDHDDYKAWAKGLRTAGYATNPRYADLLIDLIEKYELHDYDKYFKKPLMHGFGDAPIAAKEKKQRKETHNSPEINGKTSAVISHNGIPAVEVKAGDTYASLCEEYEIREWQILKYNDLPSTIPLQPGMLLYLKPKRGKPSKTHHVVEPGESMHDISQRFGIKLKKLYKSNGMEEGLEPALGTKIALYGKREDPVKDFRQRKDILAERKALKEELIAHQKEAEKRLNPKPEVKKEQEKPTEKEPVREVSTIKIEESTQIPSGREKFTHIVSPGETIYFISRKYEMEVSLIKEVNNLESYAIKSGQPLIVYREIKQEEIIEPAEDPTFSEEIAPPGNTVEKGEQTIIVHEVQQGESLFGISRKYNVEIASIREWNDMEDSSIKLGQKLRIYPPGKVEERNIGKTHTVQPGDTLYSISKKYNIPVSMIRELNNLNDYDISVGEKLIISRNQ